MSSQSCNSTFTKWILHSEKNRNRQHLPSSDSDPLNQTPPQLYDQPLVLPMCSQVWAKSDFISAAYKCQHVTVLVTTAGTDTPSAQPSDSWRYCPWFQLRKDAQPTQWTKLADTSALQLNTKQPVNGHSPHHPDSQTGLLSSCQPRNSDSALNWHVSLHTWTTQDTLKSLSALSFAFLSPFHPPLHSPSTTNSFLPLPSLPHPLLLSCASLAGPQIPLAEMKAVIRFKDSEFDQVNHAPSKKK